jgi:hypothetical protein
MKQYVVIDRRMYLKVDGEITDIPQPLSSEVKSEVEAVWQAYDSAGRPLIYYHRSASCLEGAS